MLKLWRSSGDEVIALLIGASVLMVLGALLVSDFDIDSEVHWALVLLYGGWVTGGCALVLTLVGRRQYFWIGRTHFGLRSAWPFPVINVYYRIVDYVGTNWEKSGSVVRLNDETSLVVPRGMGGHVSRLAAELQNRRDWILYWERVARELKDPEPEPTPLTPSAHWPAAFTFEQSRSREPLVENAGEIKIDDPDALRSLIHHYRAAAIFRESFPPAFDLVKIFIGLKRSNGGLVLIGVHPSGKVVGLPEDELSVAQERLEHLASELTTARVEIGRIEFEGKSALFAVFNATLPNLRPMDSFEKATSDVVIV